MSIRWKIKIRWKYVLNKSFKMLCFCYWNGCEVNIIQYMNNSRRWKQQCENQWNKSNLRNWHQANDGFIGRDLFRGQFKLCWFSCLKSLNTLFSILWSFCQHWYAGAQLMCHKRKKSTIKIWLIFMPHKNTNQRIDYCWKSVFFFFLDFTTKTHIIIMPICFYEFEKIKTEIECYPWCVCVCVNYDYNRIAFLSFSI